MNKKRIVAGIILIVLSLAAMVLWETKGRNQVMLDEVVVLTKGIPRGTRLAEEHLSKGRVLKESRVEGSVSWQDADKVIGKYLTVDMGKKAQLSNNFIAEKWIQSDAEQSIFVIPAPWIYMKSSSLRRGDWAEIIDSNGQRSFGSYRIAFVKDSSGAEVTDEIPNEKDDPLERLSGSAPVDHVEIIANLDEYENLYNAVVSEGAMLLIVQREIF